MALLDGKTHKKYYEGNNLGGYQFVSLQDVIAQFMAIYVGEEKIINKVGRTEVAFHAQRALAELSFDTLKSFKSQSIVLPPSLVMSLPHDYVNYTKLSWCDESGIKHPIYKTNSTSNPFQVSQDADGDYLYGDSFSTDDFQLALPIRKNDWDATNPGLKGKTVARNTLGGPGGDSLSIAHRPHNRNNVPNVGHFVSTVYKAIDITDFDFFSFSANATTNAAGTQTITTASTYIDPNDSTAYSNQQGFSDDDPEISLPFVNGATGDFVTPASTVRIGLMSTVPSENTISQQMGAIPPSPNFSADIYDIGYIEWTAGESGIKTSDVFDVDDLTGDVYIVITSIAPWTVNDAEAAKDVSKVLEVVNTVSSVVIDLVNPINKLVAPNESSTWNKYKAVTPAENNNDDYANDDYQRVPDERYGLDPAFAQTNGSFYIDDRLGRIHFSSNISGKTVILDYISDSLGTEAEMQIHKLAEEAMYKNITYSVLSVKSNIPEYIVMRARKEKIAANRKAKLRLSNIKIEDITQILRGKSKHIKH
tara:strand:+ start:725 stop:2326 length:1602 start_codon:yes stop_codon:yes gene_type:complete